MRRLHSITGIVPVGAFLLEHFISNAFATNGATAYALQVKFLSGLPFRVFLEVFGIFIPLLYHAFYGFYIWYRGEGNATEYPWAGNWFYTSQRWTGAIAFAYILYHTWVMRFSGVHLPEYPGAAFGKVQMEFFTQPWTVGFYIVGIIAASWHFSYGIWLFAAKWGITVGENARKKFGYVCTAFAVLLIVLGLATIRAFYQFPQQAIDPAGAKRIEAGEQYNQEHSNR
ncbi:MAG TPA: succinate dehydrogenase [Clostridia bacterium]|nr:succinate dehydrogenase [Clostridia bacterium]